MLIYRCSILVVRVPWSWWQRALFNLVTCCQLAGDVYQALGEVAVRDSER